MKDRKMQVTTIQQIWWSFEEEEEKKFSKHAF